MGSNFDVEWTHKKGRSLLGMAFFNDETLDENLLPKAAGSRPNPGTQRSWVDEEVPEGGSRRVNPIAHPP